MGALLYILYDNYILYDTPKTTTTMKKLTLALLTLGSFGAAQAQVFVGGTGGVGYGNDAFRLYIVPKVGYAFSERWAVGAGLGMILVADDGCAFAGKAKPFVRYTPWRNEHVAFDVKAVADMTFQRSLNSCEVGLRPSLRVFLDKHFELVGEVGLIGAQYNGQDWLPAVFASGMDATLGVAYKF